MQNLFSLITQIGTAQYLTVNTPFLLNQPDKIWWVAQGNINLYSTRLDEEHQAMGKRFYFCEIAKNQIISGMNTQTEWKTTLPETDTAKALKFFEKYHFNFRHIPL